MKTAVCTVALLLAIAPSSRAQTWDAFADFACANPNSAWSYGWRTTAFGTGFVPMTACVTPAGCPILRWYEPTIPAMSLGRPISGATSCDTWSCPAGYMLGHPGPGNEHSVLRWTAPAAAQISVNVTFQGIDFAYPTTTDGSLWHNGALLWNVNILSYGVPYPHTAVLNVAAGDKIDTVIASLGSYYGDATGLTLTIVATCPSASVAPLGAGCGPVGPQLSSTLPQIGSTVTISVTGAPPSVSGSLFVGAPAPELPIGGGCSVHLDISTIFEFAPIATDLAGNWTLSFPFPNALSLTGISAGLQGVVLLPALPGFQVTSAILVTIGC